MVKRNFEVIKMHSTMIKVTVKHFINKICYNASKHMLGRLSPLLPCLSASECIETKALMAGYVMLLTEANTPAAHIILQATQSKHKFYGFHGSCRLTNGLSGFCNA